MTAAGLTTPAVVDELVEIDVERPSLYRMYSYWYYGGKDHYEIDRDTCHALAQHAPGWELAVRASRAWLRHRVCDLAARGIDQFLVLDAGFPVLGEIAVHELAAQHLGERPSRVVYADPDPLASLHNRAELADNVYVHAVQADLADPAALLDRARAAGSLVNWSQPVAVLLPDYSLSHVPDDPGPAEIVRRYRELLAPRSWVVASHYADPGRRSPAHETASVLQQQFTTWLGSGRFRTPAEIAACFDGLELRDPGVADLTAWPPPLTTATPLPVEAGLFLCGVGRIPDPTQRHGHNGGTR
ncbi:SAM-dependent methyltransferase [Nocardia wallacei]|uniref:SAM-dependent methyltransferase n=1 Tax=Nocardia wallacei TaxID=480035 RepID=UPI002453CD7E|nr:SAM-dependent methyltransferase [Nocardia wallacei]